MKRVRQRIREVTPKNRCHADLRNVIGELNPILRGWGQYFRTGNAAVKFNRVDDYVCKRLKALRVKRMGRHLKAGETPRWTKENFHGFGLFQLGGTIQYPEAA